ncbi:flagellar biosynthetic protein FliR [Edaphobacter albus]|uniref:flagellar biosynthetic protein FliR n=1 Tax=Edaphobacter sp. 4G125 TaxID=2763071 RepID=UPI0016482DCF|nr:flagellar biosynthetic protein FliR [Edaphobacter sp. 4G125]QNI35277.1 flagellar biosynthetic protein FliR [Edaphobacter sp. 4G125]
MELSSFGWPQLLVTGLLVMIRVSGLLIFAPFFSSIAITPRIKAGFIFALTVLLTPAVAVIPDAKAELDVMAVLGELGVGFVFGLTLMMLNEALMFAGTLLGMQFSFSLVNLMDPNSKIETPVLGQMLSWFGLLVLIGVGLDRTLLAAMVRSFRDVPVGHALMKIKTGTALAAMAGEIFLSGLQLAAPVIAAAMIVEVTVALIGKIAPQLPAMVLGIPLKTLISFGVLVGSLALWPGWIEHYFSRLLDAAERLIAV